MSFSDFSPVANHLWQSTLCAALAGLLTLWLRRNRARTRHTIWAIASVKFLLPFSAILWLGGQVHWRGAAIEAPSRNVEIVLGQVSRPFSPVSTSTQPPAKSAAPNPLPEALLVLWAAGFLAVAGVWFLRWRRLRRTVRAGSAFAMDAPIRVVKSAGRLEPGVFGILRPVLFLPDDIEARLSPAQFQAVLAHELCHVRHRDNLIAAAHMLVESVFWFYPPVWWMGKRMLAERERACDEEVVAGGNDRRAYAQGILDLCKCYVESPLACAAGVSGADLNKRVVAIMRGNPVARLSWAKRFVLASCASAAMLAPLCLGLLRAPALHAQTDTRPKFEVASVKSCDPGGRIMPNMQTTPGALRTGCAMLLGRDQPLGLIQRAYVRFADGGNRPRFELVPVVGAPDWVYNSFYQIDAKAPGNTPPGVMQGPMLQALLEERFHLKVHRESIEGQVYELTAPKGAAKLQPFVEGSCEPPPSSFPSSELPKGQRYCKNLIMLIQPAVIAEGSTVLEFSKLLNIVLDRPTVDKTGLQGKFNLHVAFSKDETTPGLTPMPADAPAPASEPNPNIFQALQQQLGLKLTPARGPIERLVIDHVERPAEN